ncbi:MAG: substrate-binding domain-containing protein [Clostridiales bacterium]|nr:substrate-binding domain-containing protein [Clostridiales bacterium]
MDLLFLFILSIPFNAMIAMIVALCLRKRLLAKITGTVLACFGITIIWFISLLAIGFSSAYNGPTWLLNLPAVLALAATLLFIWKPFRAKLKLSPAIAFAVLFILSLGAIIGVQAYENAVSGVAAEQIALSEYEPFAEHNRLATLSEAADLQFAHDAALPRLDGATALYPLYAAFAQAVYPKQIDNYNLREKPFPLVDCTRTDQAFKNLLAGAADIVFLMDLSPAMLAAAEEAGVTLQLTPIGRESFVFFVNGRNPVENLSLAQIKGIYSGEITDWRVVGGRNWEIHAFQRNEESGSQIALRKMMGETPVMRPNKEDIYSTMGGFAEVVSYKNYKNAIGYSFRYYMTEMIQGGKIKMLSVDGFSPSDENYPLVAHFYALTVVGRESECAENIALLLEWILSEQGQYLVEKTGYTPLS